MADEDRRGRLWYDGDEVDPATFPAKLADDWTKFRGYCRDCGREVFGGEAAPYPDACEQMECEDSVPIVQCMVCGQRSADMAGRFLGGEKREKRKSLFL